MKKRTKQIIAITIIVILLLLLLFPKSQTTLPINNTIGSGISYGGGSTSGSPTSTSTPVVPAWSFPDFTFPSFTFPCFFNCEAESTIIDTSRSTPVVECTRHSDCFKCANAAYDTCENNKCICKAPAVDNWFVDLPLINLFTPQIVVLDTTECSRNTDCNKCANPTYDACSLGQCICSAPVVETTRLVEETPIITSIRTITPECIRSTDCNKCANPTYDTCLNNVCVCQAPIIGR